MISSDPGSLDLLQKMNREWPYFRALLNNTEMALTKADMSTAKEYSDLCEDKETAERIYSMICSEFEKTVKHILSITGEDHILADSPALDLSLSRRDPYLDPLSHIQILLLKRSRDPDLSEEEQKIWLQPLLRSINAVAAGMRNTG